MRKIKGLIAGGLILAYLAAPLALVQAAEKKEKPKKPYVLKTCLVSDEALDSMGEPYVFVHEGQEIKLCCKSCLKGFNKDKAKHIKKLEKAEKELAAKKAAGKKS